MKYSNNNKPKVCMQTSSTCYTGTKTMTIKGILWHSTGANNPNLKRYVQPSDNAADKAEMLKLLGVNSNKNDWNHIYREAGLNAWIGKFADGTVGTIQTMPWNYRPWGCGAGSKGSCNNGWIQFEICEDGLTDKNYFEQIYKEACELTAYLCKLYNLNPKGSTVVNGVTIPTILCHQDSYKLGMGGNHGDIYHWFKNFNKDMDDVRNDVAKLLGNTATTTTSSNVTTLKFGNKGQDVKTLQTNLNKLGYDLDVDGDFGNKTHDAVIDFQKKMNIEVDGIVGAETQSAIKKCISENWKQNETHFSIGDEVMLVAGAVYSNGKTIPAWLFKSKLYVRSININGTITFSTLKTGVVTGTAAKKYFIPYKEENVKVVSANTKKYNPGTLAAASIDENGGIHGGKAGDQTGKEVKIQEWYNGNWNVILRPTDSKIADKIATAAEEAALNDLIGYDQYERNSLYTQAKKTNYNLANIKEYCECDCSSLASICCICAGLDAKYFYIGNNMRCTSNLREACLKTGKFKALEDTKYTKSKDYLKRGDIVLRESGHVTMCIADGDKANEPTTETKSSAKKVKITANVLNVRSGPGTNYKTKSTVKKNQVCTIKEIKNGWGKLSNGTGWINLAYTVEV